MRLICIIFETNMRSGRTHSTIQQLARACRSPSRNVVLARVLMYVGMFENRSGDGASSHLWTGA